MQRKAERAGIKNEKKRHQKNTEMVKLSKDDETAKTVEKIVVNITDTSISFSKTIDYHTHFPHLTAEVNGLYLNKYDFARLSKWENSNAQYLNDKIINSFLSILPEVAKKKKKKTRVAS